MQIEFPVSGLKPSQRRRREPAKGNLPVAPLVRAVVLAYQIDQAIQDGRARDYADVARQIGMTRARVSQIMRLLQLPPALLERLVLDDRILSSELTERQFRPLVAASGSISPLEGIERLFPVHDHACGS